MNKTPIAHILVLLATFLIALSFIVSEKLSGIIDPISLTLYRFVFASVVLSPVIFLKKKYRNKIKQSFKKAMVISFFYSLYFIGLFKALEFTSSLNTATIFTITPLITALFSIVIFKQKLTILQFIIYIIGMAGTCIVVFKGELKPFLNFALNYGDIIFLIAIIFMSLYSISAKYFYKEDDEVLTITFMTLIGGCFWMSIALVIFDIPLQWQKIEGELFFYMAYLSIGATLVTVYLYQKAIIVIGAKKLMAYIYINPAFTAIILYFFYGTNISLWEFFGVIVSIIVTILLL